MPIIVGYTSFVKPDGFENEINKIISIIKKKFLHKDQQY